MIGTKRIPTVILASCILLGINGVCGSRHSCRTSAVVDLTDEERDSSGSVNKSGDVYPRESMWDENGRILGCPCEFKTCIELCCPEGTETREDDCIRDELKLLVWFENDQENKDVHLFVDESCPTENSMIKKYGNASRGGLLFRTTIPDAKTGFAEYCQQTDSQFIIELLGVCSDKNGYGLLVWFISCMNISMLFALATLIVHSVIPELKSLQGSIFRCYLASYIFCIILFTAYLLLALNKPPNTVQTISAVVFVYFGIACMVWLNVMSFDIWRTFRKFETTEDMENSNANKLQTKRFVCYSIYTWGGSVILFALMCLLPKIFTSISPVFDEMDFTQYVRFLPIAGVSICNICLYISTALRIKKCKKETARVVDGQDNRHQQNEQWFNSYLKLFVIMGGPLLLWAVAIHLLNNQIFWKIVYVTEALQGFFIFVIFVWKDDVKWLLRKKFNKMLGSSGRCDQTPDIEN